MNVHVNRSQTARDWKTQTSNKQAASANSCHLSQSWALPHANRNCPAWPFGRAAAQFAQADLNSMTAAPEPTRQQRCSGSTVKHSGECYL